MRQAARSRKKRSRERTAAQPIVRHAGGELFTFDRRAQRKRPFRPDLPRLPFKLRYLLIAVICCLLYFVLPASEHKEKALPQLLTAKPTPSLDPLSFTAGYSFSHVVARGEALGGIFSAYGLGSSEAQLVYDALKEISSATIRSGQRLHFQLGADGLLRAMSTDLNARQTVQVLRADDEHFTASMIERQSKSQERVANGAIQSSFAKAAYEAGLPHTAIDDLVDLFGDRISFHRDFRKGDAFSIVYRDTILDDGTSLGVGTILAAALEVGGEVYCAVRYIGADGTARYFDQNAELLGSAFLRYPVKFSRISSSFSRSRFHPVLKRNRPHNGTDFAAPTGTPVRSVGAGRVQFAGRKGGNGNMVKIRHTKRYTTAYLHLHRIAKGLRRGAKVERGQVIGTVGMTGLATGPHLHYSLYDNGRFVDPLKAKLPKIEKLSADQRVDQVYLRRVLYTLEHYRGRKIEMAEVEPVKES